MRLIRYTHACVRFEDGDRVLVVDPGCWTEPEALDGASAVLVTHQHNDHIDPDLLVAAHKRKPELQVYADAETIGFFDGSGIDMQAVEVGDSFEAAGFGVRAFGGRHATIWGDKPDIPNIGYLVNESVYVPGDSLVPPGVPVDTLFVPIHASWMKIGEAIAFARAVGPRRAHPIHDGQMHERGYGSADKWLREESGTEYVRLEVGVPVDLT